MSKGHLLQRLSSLIYFAVGCLAWPDSALDMSLLPRFYSRPATTRTRSRGQVGHRDAMTPAWLRGGAHRASRESSSRRDGRYPAKESAAAAAAHPRLREPRGAPL